MAAPIKFAKVNHVSITLLTLVTAGVHFWLASQPEEELHFLFLLNALGYVLLLGAFLLPQLQKYHSKIRWVFLGYTLLTIAAWFVMGSPREGTLDPFDVVVKLVESILAVQLFMDRSLEGKTK